MFNAEREAYRALQQYKADLQRSKIQLRRSSTVESSISPEDFQYRGRPTEQDRGSIERARRGSDGDNARSTKMKCSQGLALKTQPGLVKWESNYFNHNVNEVGSATETSCANPSGRSITSDLITNQSMSYPPSAFAGSAILGEDPNAQRSRIVRLDELSATTTVRVPTFARQIIARASAFGDFVHHRDTFIIAKAKGGASNKSKPITPPRPIVVNLIRYIDHQTYLSLRLVSRSWSKAIDRVKPPQYPAVYRVPIEVVQQIYYCVLAESTVQSSDATSSINDFNNARHSCRAWMAASLDKRLINWAFVRGGLKIYLYMVEAEFQDPTDTDEDDLAVLWEMSLQLSSYCRSTFFTHEPSPDGALRTL